MITHASSKLSEPEAMRAVWVEVFRGRGNHGSFLMAFADCYLRADPVNQQILRSASAALINNYNLSDYALAAQGAE